METTDDTSADSHTENPYSSKRSQLCFICDQISLPSKAAIFALKSHDLDAQFSWSRISQLSTFFQCLSVQNLEIYEKFSTSPNFPFCSVCLKEVADIIKIEEELKKIKEVLELIVQKIKLNIFKSSDEEAKKESTKSENVAEFTNNWADNYDELRDAFRNEIIEDVKTNEILAKMAGYTKPTLTTNKMTLGKRKKSPENSSDLHITKSFSLNSSSQPNKIIKISKNIEKEPCHNQEFLNDDSSQIEEVIISPPYSPHSQNSKNSQNIENELDIQKNFTSTNAEKLENLERGYILCKLEVETTTEYEPHDFDDSFFSAPPQNQVSDYVNGKNYENNIKIIVTSGENGKNFENVDEYGTADHKTNVNENKSSLSYIAYKDFQTDYEKEMLLKTPSTKTVKKRPKISCESNDEISKISEIFGSIPPTLNYVQNLKFSYESYEIECILDEANDKNNRVKCVSCSKEWILEEIKKRVQHTNPFTDAINHIRAYHIGEYKCRQCNIEFWSKYTLWLHVIKSSAHQSAVVSCEVCGKPARAFNTKSILARHIWSHKSEDEKNALIAAGEKEPAKINKRQNYKSKKSDRVSCPTCKKMVQSEALKNHLATHSGKKFICHECGRSFCSLTSLKFHIRNDHEELNKFKFYCTICGKYFSQKQAFERHKHKTCTICSKPISWVRESNYIEQDLHYECAKKIEEKKLAKETLAQAKYAHFLDSLEKNKVVKEESEKKPRRRPPKPEPISTCDKCGKEFSRREYLNNHFKTVHNKDLLNFSCTFCPMKFRINSNLQTHLNKHTKELKWTCACCGVVKYSKKDLKLHEPSCFHWKKRREELEIELQNENPNYITSKNVNQKKKAPSIIEKKKEKEVTNSFLCKFCLSFFEKETDLVDHIEEVHG